MSKPISPPPVYNFIGLVKYIGPNGIPHRRDCINVTDDIFQVWVNYSLFYFTQINSTVRITSRIDLLINLAVEKVNENKNRTFSRTKIYRSRTWYVILRTAEQIGWSLKSIGLKTNRNIEINISQASAYTHTYSNVRCNARIIFMAPKRTVSTCGNERR